MNRGGWQPLPAAAQPRPARRGDWLLPGLLLHKAEADGPLEAGRVHRLPLLGDLYHARCRQQPPRLPGQLHEVAPAAREGSAWRLGRSAGGTWLARAQHAQDCVLQHPQLCSLQPATRRRWHTDGSEGNSNSFYAQQIANVPSDHSRIKFKRACGKQQQVVTFIESVGHVPAPGAHPAH